MRRDAAPASEQEPLPSERQFIDIDPWTVLLEQLMEVSEEEPPTGRGTRGK